MFLLLLSTSAYSECFITASKERMLTDLLDEKDWSFDNYIKVCEELERNNLGVRIGQMDIISESGTAVATLVQVYPLEISKKYKKQVLATLGMTGIETSPKKSDKELKRLIYKNANSVMNDLIEDEVYWNRILDEVKFIREHIK